MFAKDIERAVGATTWPAERIWADIAVICILGDKKGITAPVGGTERFPAVPGCLRQQASFEDAESEFDHFPVHFRSISSVFHAQTDLSPPPRLPSQPHASALQ